MRIEKFVHSCLKVTLNGARMLFDPGKFSFVDGRVDPAQLSDADFILFTHGHPGRLDLDTLRAIVGKRGPRILAGDKVVATFKKAGFAADAVSGGHVDLGPFDVRALPVCHEPILAEERPVVWAFVVNGRFLNPGDSFDQRFTSSPASRRYRCR